ncbi:MAG: low molecular weight phosphotyrosine protein phosphatase [Saprospiraceae bacterium]|nr:low molecular weight phosphotyrosine protein phosphatase [Saprospiraceae bacterium]
MKILMVCLGNICRSPLAEGILKEKIRARGLDWQVDSAGTGGWHAGELPDHRSIKTARRHGIDLTDQRARQLRAADLEQFDLVLAMDASNRSDILRLARTEAHRNKVEMIMNFLHAGSDEDVPDPYWDDNGFEAVFQMLEEACEALIEGYT